MRRSAQGLAGGKADVVLSDMEAKEPHRKNRSFAERPASSSSRADFA